MKDVNFNITKDFNDTTTYGFEAAFVEMAAELGINKLKFLLEALRLFHH